MTLTSGNLKDCEIQGGGTLQKKGEKYWQDLSDYYMKEASDKAWDARRCHRNPVDEVVSRIFVHNYSKVTFSILSFSVAAGARTSTTSPALWSIRAWPIGDFRDIFPA